MMDTVLAYFSENLTTVSKEAILIALENALLSAIYWREACLLWLSTAQAHGLKGCDGTGRLSSQNSSCCGG